MTKFAAYDDLSIYAVADTANQALRSAVYEARCLESQFKIAKVHYELACRIIRDGWDGNTHSFRIEGGFIIDTTDE